MHIKTAWKYIRRSPYQALAAVMIMTFTFFIAAIFLILATGSGAVLKYFETKPQITVFFKDKIKTSQIEDLKKTLNNTNKVISMKFVSKEEALAIYKEQNKKDPLLLEMVSADILPASLEISAVGADDLKYLYDLVKKNQIVEEVVFQKDIIETLTKWTNAIRKIGIGLLSFLIFVSVLIIVTIIGMKIAIRKEEIEILRLVGATNWYIRWPFIWEGILYGLTGAVVAWILIVILFWQTTPFLTSFLSGIPLLPVNIIFVFILLGILLIGGIIIGVIGSMLALWRYLK